MGDGGTFLWGTLLLVLLVSPLVASVGRFWLRIGRAVVGAVVRAALLVLRAAVAVLGFVWAVWVEVRAGMNGQRRAD